MNLQPFWSMGRASRAATRPALANYEGNKLLWQTSAKHGCKLIVNWEKNRPPDPVRIAALRGYVRQQGYMPGVIYTFSR